MYILITAAQEQGAVSLEEPDDCRRFQLTIHGLSAGAAARMLEAEGVGRLAEEDTAWIDIAALRRLAAGRVGADWPQRFAAMIDYARRKGWLSADGQSVRGHIERS